MNRITLVLALALAACSAPKQTPNEDFSDLDALDQKSDAFSSRMRLLGALTDGQTRDVYYTSSPRYRAYTLDGAGALDLWVRSDTGDAVAYLLDSHFRVVKKNDDANTDTLDAHITATLPDAQTYYLVVRDYDGHRGWFSVERVHHVADSAALKCTGTGRIATIPDECMDDGGAGAAGDSLEVYCVNHLARFCLSGEACPWRDGAPATDDGATCSRSGLDDPSAERDQYGDGFLTHAWCSQWHHHGWYYCDQNLDVSFGD
jgi:hypothetical protein